MVTGSEGGPDQLKSWGCGSIHDRRVSTCKGSEVSGIVAPSGNLKKATVAGAQIVRMQVADGKA